MSERVGRAVRRGFGLLLAGGAVLALAGCEIPGPHTTITVTTTTDGNDAVPGNGVCEMTPSAGNCSLRAAIDEANATPGNPPRIVVPAGTYSLTDPGTDDNNAGGDLDVDPVGNRLLIEGQGSGAVIDANGADRGLDVHGGLTVAKRIAVIDSGTAGVTARNNTVVELQASSVHDNAGAGLVASTGGVVSTVNTTISGNGGGGVNAPGTYIGLFSTITANTGGGITGTGTAFVRASIVGGQTTGADCAVPVTSQGHNLDSDATCGLNQPSDLPGLNPDLGPLSPDPIPRHLPLFLSHVIDEIPPGTEPCGTAGFPTTDQAGWARPSGSGCDLGAVESEAPLAITVDSGVDQHDASPGDGVCDVDAPPVGVEDCNLRAAIDETNARSGPDLVSIKPGVDTVVSLAGANENNNATGDLDVKSPLTILANGNTIGMDTVDRVFHVQSVNLTLDDAVVTNGQADIGAGLYFAGTPSTGNITNSTIEGNHSTGFFYCIASEFFSECSGNGGGNGIWNEGNLIVDHTAVAFNHPFAGTGCETSTTPFPDPGTGTICQWSIGGGIVNTPNAVLTVRHSTVAANSTFGSPLPQPQQLDVFDGGGISSAGLLNIRNSTISNNHGNRGGGVITTGTKATTIRSSTVVDNLADQWGSAIFRNGTGTVTVSGSVVAGSGSDCDGAISSAGYNIDSDGTCSFDEPTDVGTAGPLLGSLADNGGPTATHLPHANSPVLDAIPGGTAGLCDATLPTDQRGVVRPGGPACDIGAVEGHDSTTVPALNLVVNTSADGQDIALGNGICATSGGGCTLRAAIQETNASATADTITIAGGVDPTLTLAGTAEDGAGTGDLDVVGSVTIDANGAVIDGNGLDRVFDVRDGLVEVREATITGGLTDGFDGHDGTAVLARGGTLVLRADTVTQNVAQFNAYVTIIQKAGGDLLIENSTVSANTGGAILSDGDVEVLASTVTDHSSYALRTFGGSLTLRGSVIDNPGTACSADLVSEGYNIVSDASCNGLQPSDQIDPQPLLGPLVDNGGPTPTRLPFADSPAVNRIPAGTADLCDAVTVDQRGVSRPAGPACDIGAVEGDSGVSGGTPLSLVVDVATDGHDDAQGDGECDDGTGHCPLRAAIDESNGWPAIDTITIAPAIDPTLSIAGSGENANQMGDLDITDGVTIDGDGATIDGNGLDRVIDTPFEIDLALIDLTVTGGDVTGSGGGIYGHSKSELTLVGVTVTGNLATELGGGVEAFGLTATSSTFTDNATTGTTDTARGGGIAARRVTLTDVQIQGNEAAQRGGGLSVECCTAETDPNAITASIISGNTAAASGGGLAVMSFSDLTITDTTVSGNDAGDDGGGIADPFFNVGGQQLTLVGSTVSGNAADLRGGGLFIAGSALVVTNSTFSGNSAAVGGGIARGSDFGSPSSLTAVTFAQNVATGGGSAIDNDGTDLVTKGTILSGTGADCTGDIAVVSAGHNVGSDASCALTQPTDQPSAAISLASLANNGGPTRTHLPSATSAGVDDIPVGTAGLCDGSLPTDQRGVARPGGPACDVGGVEGTGGAVTPLAITVSSPLDAPDATPGDGTCATASATCTLRAAIDEANAWLAADTITIAAGIDPELSIAGIDESVNASGDLDISDPLTLRGNGATVDANGIDRVFHVLAPTTLESLTITGGSTLAGDSGFGSVATAGAAVFAASDLNLVNATLEGNEGVRGAGGLHVAGGNTVVTASTFALNATVYDGHDISSSGGGVAVRSSVFTSASPACSALIVSGGYNVGADASCGLTQPTDHPSTDPMTESIGTSLGALVFEPYANSVLVNAIPAGTADLCNGTIATDERGVARPQGGACDIGAVEGSNGINAAAPLSLIVNSALDQHDTNPGDGVCATAAATCTLRAAIDEANQWPRDDLIIIQAGVNPTLSLAGLDEDLNATGDLDVLDTMTITGNGGMIDAALLDRAVHHRQGTLAFDHVEVRRGRLSAASNRGGGIFAQSTLTLDAVTINDNRLTVGASNLGGGVAMFGAHADIRASTFVANSVAGFGGFGGAFYLTGYAEATIINSTFSANNGFGGSAISASQVPAGLGPVTVTASTFAGNTGLGTFGGTCSCSTQVKASVIELAPSATCGLLQTMGWNLASSSGCWLSNPQPGDVAAAPLLGPLANNGGPTRTHLPGAGSPAINSIPAGTAELCDGTIPTDQRGVARPTGGACDKGAVEQ